MKDIEKNEIEITIKIDTVMPLRDAKAIVERELITKVMEKVKSTYKAAEILQVSQATISRKSKRYNDEIYY
ncbi:regulatory protein, Fis family [Dethiosulfatibacter aminovorans DSM 17477]|uniref:Regulatory protein, Fis family n=1 Tax=Dethiosulfatibacter aminovorans DSM 17477 TaxID=1121476 RepID=A0A1M6IZ52_9FIRM|nr:helix-turn-helix domain-containing protein [Dethiosulfatibacter aminovorans]SHJ39647.1 regulatory protein, Fis family [Dethiosulfatibacter aminovorans DSM 17477]